MKFRALSIAALLAISVSLCFAQQNRTIGGELSGTVLTPDGHPVKDARVEVRDITIGSMVASGYSLPGGGFSFDNIPTGHYEVRAVVGLQEARERIDMDPMMLSRQITLRVAAPEAQSGGGATVSLTELRVSGKAKNELQKAQEAFHKRNMDEARKHCDKALALAPTYSRALSLGALLDLSENHYESALAKAEQAIKSDSGYGMGYVVLGAVYNTGSKYQDAIRALDRGLPLVPTSWQAYFEMSKAQLGTGNYRKALANVDRSQQIAPADYAPLHLVRAHALLGLKAYNDAIQELEKFIGNDSDASDKAQALKTLDQVKAFVATAKK